MERDQLRPTPAVRALDAGHRKQNRRLRSGDLLDGYWPIIDVRLVERNRPEALTWTRIYVYTAGHQSNQSVGVTTLTSLPGTWITRIGSRPFR